MLGKMLKGGFFIHQKLCSAIVHWASIFLISFITLTNPAVALGRP